MAESLNVIALISGGKDSFFSLLHCLQKGHKVVALGNLYPPSKTYDASSTARSSSDEEEEDLNSFMYQTVGHQVIPLYSEALALPLYRQEIRGRAVVTDLAYANPMDDEKKHQESGDEETESLVPLLRKIMDAHPEANALSTGAILSTYQRTRIESIALRLGLTPLSYLWQYPYLPGHSDITLLQDMSAVDLDARIIKVASGGLDESFLWETVASVRGMSRLEKAAKRFGIGGGAVMGEGGEYETLVVDGPDEIFKGRIVVEDSDRHVVREGGGAAWLRIKRAKVVMKNEPPKPFQLLRPKLLEPRFERIFENLKLAWFADTSTTEAVEVSKSDLVWMTEAKQNNAPRRERRRGITHRTFGRQSCLADIPLSPAELTLEEEMEGIVCSIQKFLDGISLKSRDIVFAMIILQSMGDFAAINKIYGTLFPSPNPAARVTIACGDVLPGNARVMIHLTIFDPGSFSSYPYMIDPVENIYADTTEPEHDLESRIRTLRQKVEALHVQSRSYWAPANIGPYSQAMSIPSAPNPTDRIIYVAGQIALIPASMSLPTDQSKSQENFCLQAILSLQHLWQIGREMNVNWFTGAIAFLATDSISAIKSKAIQAGKAWTQIHEAQNSNESGEEEEERDLWEEKHHYDLQIRGGTNTPKQFPNKGTYTPPFFAAEVQELPRQSLIEWQAILGLRGEHLTYSSQFDEDHGTMHFFETAEICGTGHFIVAVPVEISEVAAIAIRNWLQFMNVEAVPQAAYLDVNVKEFWGSDMAASVVPCKSLWDSDGNRLAAVLVYMR